MSRTSDVGSGSGSKGMRNAPAMERMHLIPMDRQSRASRGVCSGLTAWYSAAESIMATRATSQLRDETGDRNHIRSG